MSAQENNTATKKNTTKSTSTAAKVESYDIARSDETLDLAKDLARFIKENKLSTQVQGKEFVNVEGWQYAGSRLGIVPIVEHVINVSTEQELKYQAKVTLFDMRSQHTVGAGFAVCSNKESGKKFYQEFAIMSMAQTRAIGKAYRNILAWIIRAAGYEPTPAEEMEYSGNVPAPTAQPEPTGNVQAASEPPVMRAESSSAAPVASTGSDQKIAGPASIPAEIIAKLTRQFEAATSGIDVKKLWDSLTKNEATALFDVKEAAKARLATPPVVRQIPAQMKDAGTDSELVDEFVTQPTLILAADVLPTYATQEQREFITRLLDHPKVTRKEKTKLLLNINKLDKERARQAIIKLRTAIGEREGIDPLESARASVKAFVKRYEGKLSQQQAEGLTSLAASREVTLEFLLDALDLAQEALLDDETYGTAGELAEVEAAEAASQIAA
jgi:hypothetical protein